ncbi:MAG: hypothetical protein COC01_01275 [Bacteroidetes bacterium]|nr:hypothetical protein [Bacteroidia bacterium]PCH69513.1 MAG: hypothetical protein COC01_01275 [Bacteroidota bacterium]
MNKFIFRTLSLSFLLSILYTGCKLVKDPNLDLTEKKDMLSGKWNIVSVTVDDENKMDDIESLDIDLYSFGYDNTNDYTEVAVFDKSGNYLTDDSTTCGPIGYWSIKEDGNDYSLFLNTSNLYCGPKYDSLIIPLFIGLPENWEILRLNDESLWLKLTRDGKEYETHFDK